MKDKVFIKLLGGLGNNLFQIATAYAYAKRHDKELVLVKEKHGTTHGSLDTYDNNILSKIKYTEQNDLNLANYLIYQEPHFHYAEIPKVDGNIFLNGYFQSEKYFEDCRADLLELFSGPQEYREAIIEKYKDLLKYNTCSIHSRRGDYLNYPTQYPVQNLNYFMKAVRQMPDDTKFLVFSDDIAWCKQNFPDIDNKFVCIEGNQDFEDLTLMSLCENNIIANSSFSWWGAYLNSKEGAIKVIPAKWFGHAMSHNTNDLYCKGWVKL